jgi:AAA family ATP:ADP antiporter
MSQHIDSDANFSPLRSFVWPIHRSELKKFLPMQLMIILICFNYSILRNLKDAIVIPSSGAEVIPFIKTWVLLPMAVLLTVAFTRLSNKYSQERVFYMMVSFFLSFFALFAYILYPLQDYFHPTESAERLKLLYPSLKWFIVLYQNWSFVLFYSMAELWSTMVLHVIFWGFANEVTRIWEARRFYSVFSISSNIAAAVAGLSVMLFISASSGESLTASAFENESINDAIWQQKFGLMTGLIIVSGIITMIIFRWMNKNVLNDASFDDLHQIKKVSRSKGKLSLKESFQYLKNSKYLLCIATLVISYNLSIHLVELVWKDQLKQLYPRSSDYMWFMSCLTLCMGIISTITSFFMSRALSAFGWTFTALLTPITMLVTSISFFAFLLFRDSLTPLVGLWGLTPLAVAVYIGFFHNCFCKAAKYSVFDATKEMAFVPLPHESKLKGKAAIDGVGSRLGKSGGSLIHQGLLTMLGSLSNSSPYIAGILLFMIFGWILATRSLGKQFHNLVDAKSDVMPVSSKPHMDTPELARPLLQRPTPSAG